MTNEKREPLLVGRRAYDLLSNVEGFDMSQVQLVERLFDDPEPAPPKPFHATRRADGELIWGEYGWIAAEGPGDWSIVDDEDPVDPTIYEMVLMVPVVVERRVLGSFACDCDTDGCEQCDGGIVELGRMSFDEAVRYLRVANARRRAHGVPLIELPGVEL